MFSESIGSSCESSGVCPFAGLVVVAIAREELPAVLRHESDRADQEVHLSRADPERDRHPREARTVHLVLLEQQLLEADIVMGVDPEQQLREGPRAHAAASGLHPEQIVEQRGHEVEVQEPVSAANEEGEDGQVAARLFVVGGAGAAQHGEVGDGGQSGVEGLRQPQLLRLDPGGPHGLLHIHREAHLHVPQQLRGACLLALLQVGQVPVVAFRDVEHRAAARRGGGVFQGRQQRLLRHQHPGAARAAEEFVPREEERVLVCEGSEGVAGQHGVHVHLHIGGRRGVVEHRIGPVAMQQDGHLVHVREDARHVAAGREGPHLDRPGLVALQLAQEVRQAHPGHAAVRHDHHLGGGLSPWQQVGMVLVGGHKHHWPQILITALNKTEEFNQLIHGCCRPITNKQNDVVLSLRIDSLS
mmetsp:Transcript_5630/g.7819  ORF Transcript_5630/g.7819 Transcript_5630/m.7819 type:complete len:415 (-) Transcript_5630:367-1611(-)